MIINVISLPARLESVKAEMQKHGLTAVYWPGVTGGKPIQNISRAHKSVVRFAKENNFDSIVIAEDDVRFFGDNSYQYFLDNRPKCPYDIFISSYYSGGADENFKIKNFRGLTLYEITSRFYDTFLNLPEDRHIDSMISLAGGEYYVSPKFCTYQEPGFSYQMKRFVDHSNRLKGKPIFGQ